MNSIRTKLLTLFMVMLVCLLAVGTAFASTNQTQLLDDEVVFFGTYRLNQGERLDGSLVVFGGVVNLEDQSLVTGDVLVFGGNVTASGTIEGNLVAIGGVVSLTETALVERDLIAPATVVRRDDGARILGQIITENIPEIEELDLPEPETPVVPQIESYQQTVVDRLVEGLQPVFSFFGVLARALIFSAVAVLIWVILPKNGEKVQTAIEAQPVFSAGFGLLSVAIFTAAVVMLALLSVTVILIPLTIPGIMLLSLALALGLLFGLIAVSADFGRRIMLGFRQQWTPTVQVALGSFSMAFILGLLSLGWLGFLGGLLWTLVGSIGLGAVLLTRFGTREYVPNQSGSGSPPEVVEAAGEEGISAEEA